MRASLGFNPADYTYGPATLSVRRMLSAWQEIDWLAPPARAGAGERALRLFERHAWLARQHHPDRYPPPTELSVERGDRARFTELATSARSSTAWDWKFSALKPLSRQHHERHGWSIEAHARLMMATPGLRPGPGDLFVSLLDAQVFWQIPGARLDFAPLGPAFAEAASWYLDYASMDLADGISWQLASGRDDTSTNPFALLLAIYGVGLWPLSFSATRIVLFEFTPVGR